MSQINLENVREYSEGFPAFIQLDESTGRLVLCGVNQCGSDMTAIDVFDLFGWIETMMASQNLGPDSTWKQFLETLKDQLTQESSSQQ
ncbi:hypothetical protein [Parasphingorhabdus sp.]|uniref:hypothetical protein n=1 Tax=Parasphingorhabdus sp. TaxID=2709688 RepID=UPI003A90A6A7